MSRIHRMKPHPKRVIWAGATLGSILGIPMESGGPPVGEALDASGLTEMPSHVCGGVDDGLSLCELFERDGAELTGRKIASGERFPLLVKRIDAQEMLSIQVHPNDAMASVLSHEPNGKSEAWYILDAQENAAVYLGFLPGTTQDQVQEALSEGGLLKLMNRVPVFAGDVIPVPAGCAHTIGAGIYLFEVQQPSDVTYRLDDFGRVDENNIPRETHPTDGLASMDIELRPEKSEPLVIEESEGGKRILLVDMGVFSIEEWVVKSSMTVAGGSLLVVQGLMGSCAVQSTGEEEFQTISAGETLIISAAVPSLKLTTSAGGSLIVARHPG